MPEVLETAETPEVAQVVAPEDLPNSEYRKLRESGPLPEKVNSAASQEAESASDSETGEDNQEHGEQPKKKGGFQKRIDKLTREKAELEARLAGQTAVKPATEVKPEPVKPAGKPESKDFDTYEAFVEALTDWKAEQRDRTKAEADARVKAETEAKAAAVEWNKQLEGARARYDDFDDVALSDARISEAVHNAIVGSDRGADLAYFLGANPVERERINALPPLKATLALGKILAALESDAGGEPPEDKKRTVSAAPPPIKPLGSKSAAAGMKRIEDMTNDEYRKARESGKIR
jgi:colicin import membrane protein